MRRHSIWFSPRDDSDPSFERVPPLWEEFRPLTWGIIGVIFAGSWFVSSHSTRWLSSLTQKIEAIERDQDVLYAQRRNN